MNSIDTTFSHGPPPGTGGDREKVPRTASPPALSTARPARHAGSNRGGDYGYVMAPGPPGESGREEEMHLPTRDVIATCLVAAAGVLYLLWVFDSTLPGMSSARITGAAVLALGFAASASAVVPTFGQLLHGSKLYLVVTSLLGLAAVAAGVQMLVTASGTGLAALMAATAALWLIATVRHSVLAKTGRKPQQTRPHAAGHRPRPAGVR